MDKFIEALREALVKLGLDEGAIEAAIKEAEAKSTQTEEEPKEGDPATEVPANDVPPELPPEGVTDETPSDVPPSADLPVDDVVPPEEVVPPTDVPPTDVPPATPPFDPTKLIAQVNELQGQLSETLKANEGLVLRIQALEEALKKAGVIENSGSNPTEVGDPLPSAAPQNPTDDVFGNVLREINGHHKY